MTYPHSTAN